MARKILVVDDSLTIQKAFAMTFGAEDVSLFAARSAEEGLAMARQARPELVIADAVMPGRSGYELCASIKADPGLRDIPVYMLASRQNPFDESRGRASGADGHFLKPFDSSQLIDQVRDAILRGATAPVAAAPAVAAAPVGATMPMRSPMAAPLDDDDYGEITIEAPLPREPAPPARESRQPSVAPPSAAPSHFTPPPMPMAPRAAPGFTPPAATGMRPSLIPGVRPGSVGPARPGSQMPGPGAVPSARSMGAAPQPAVPAPRAPFPTSMPARTLVGLPVNATQAPQRPSASPVVARGGMPSAPVDEVTPPPVAPAQVPPTPPAPVPAAQPPYPPAMASPVAVAPSVAATVSSSIDQKVAAISARGPEYEAIAKLSREIIEKVVWEVVPELAEAIVREELRKRGRL